MAAPPPVSVLVPVYNGERFLGECLDSILRQTFADCEILLADDGSTDGSWALIQKYAAQDPRIRCWKNPRNLGLQANFNCCLRAARGEYIKFVLQDDLLSSNDAVRRMAAVLDRNPAVSLVSSASFIVDAQSHRTALRRHFKNGVTSGRSAMLRCMEQATNLLGEPSVVMFRRGQAGPGFDERYLQLLDLELCMRLLESGQLHYVTEPLCAFRRHPAQATNRNSGNDAIRRDQMLLLREFMEKPWLAGVTSKHWLFGQIYGLRRNPEFRASPLRRAMLRDLGWFRYYAFWQYRRLRSPLDKLRSWLGLRYWKWRQAAPGEWK